VPTQKALVAETLLGTCKFALLTTTGELLYRGLTDVTQPPSRLDKEVAWKAIAGVFNDNVLAALFAKSADCMLAGNALRQY
jgi:hypothetical protein